MIEMLGLLGLVAAWMLGKLSFFDQYEIFNSAHFAMTTFIIYARAFLTIVNDKTIHERKRAIIESLLYVFLTIMFIYSCTYFSDTENRFIPALQVPAYTISVIVIFLIKWYLIKNNIYGKRYFYWQLVDTFFICALLILDFFICEETLFLYNWTYVLSIFLFISLALINEHILSKTNYWIHKNALVKTITNIAKDDLVDTLVIPFTRNLGNDKVYNQCVYILKYSFIRIIELDSLRRMVKKILLKAGYKKEDAILISSYFHANLMINLMRRDYDFSLVPARILDKIQEHKRCKKYKKNKRNSSIF